jgi:hypothetical protein
MLVGGIGVALAVPLTTAIAAFVAAPATLAISDAPESKPEPAPVSRRRTAPDDEVFEDGLLFRRRRHTADPRPVPDDQLEIDATDWSSWPT